MIDMIKTKGLQTVLLIALVLKYPPVTVPLFALVLPVMIGSWIWESITRDRWLRLVASGKISDEEYRRYTARVWEHKENQRFANFLSSTRGVTLCTVIGGFLFTWFMLLWMDPGDNHFSGVRDAFTVFSWLGMTGIRVAVWLVVFGIMILVPLWLVMPPLEWLAKMLSRLSDTWQYKWGRSDEELFYLFIGAFILTGGRILIWPIAGVFLYIFVVAVPCSNWVATWVAHRLFDWIPPDSLSRPLF